MGLYCDVCYAELNHTVVSCLHVVSVFFFPREKFFGTREKNRFSTRENQVVPVKISQKQPVKQKSYP